MFSIEIDKQDQFREQSAPILSQIEVQEIDTAHKNVVSSCFPCFPRMIPTHVSRYSLSMALKPVLLAADRDRSRIKTKNR